MNGCYRIAERGIVLLSDEKVSERILHNQHGIEEQANEMSTVSQVD